ncbi:MAG: NlpC/P60 family protein [Lachnospiraceae bacterium]|jgi:peptidoglycan DL-endopeptidase CwlO|nr:NlpC/P60 family protein [Lachnospiraceae bacterium]MCI6978858.1 NlpC/P60 family protein [Lachnospiraceae bacterium]MDY3255231.1 NlpC/P60 family protein [Lachnospiraceae bacterium]
MNKRILWIAMSLVMIFTNVVNVSASPISDAKNKKKDAEKKLNAINEDIEDIEDQKEDLEQEAEEYEQQLVDLLVTIQIINHDIENKEDEIETAKAEYEVALAKQEKQQWAMNKRIKYMYEKGDMNYMQILLESKKFSDAVNKSTYSEKLYAYDRYQLYLYEQTKEEVIEKQKALDEDMAELEEIKLDAVSQEEELQLLVDEYSENIENFEEQLSGAKEKASQYKEQIQKQSEQIKALEAEEQRKALEAAKKKAEEEAKRKAEEEARRKAEEEASAKVNEEGSNSEESSDNGDNNDEGNSSGSESSDGGSSGGSSSGGSAKGQEIANFACQFVGNPYVPGGTSLTEGADCSGFTMAVYNNFGLSLPRSSYAQAGYGREVSYSEAQPGDIIYYGGHVGIYIGNGLIVHASTQATGIKISNALYRSIITVRRIV